MNILLLTDGITPFVTGGMQRHSANLAKHLTLQGAKVTLVHCVDFGDSLPTDNDVNIELFGNSDQKLHSIITLHFPKKGIMVGHYLSNSYAYSKTIFEKIKDFSDYDFIYAKGFSAWYFIEQKKKGVKLPPIGVKFHGYEMFQKLNSTSQKLKAFLLKGPTKWNNENADYIFSYGGKITDLILEKFNVDRSNVFDFTSGIDNDWIREDKLHSNAPIRFIFVGRAEERKGIKELNKALQKLNEAFVFHFVGDIPKEQQITSDKIIYHGEQKDKNKIIEILDQSDVLVCPSHSEGMPNVIIEGMARGLAVLATDVGAVEKLVDDSNGKLIPPLQQDKLEHALKMFIEMPKEELSELKQKSIEKTKNNYLWEKITTQLMDTLENIVK